MSSIDSIKPLLNELLELKKFLDENDFKNMIDISSIIEKIVNREKNYILLKHNFNKSKERLNENLEMLKSKNNIEYEIYKVLTDHKNKLNMLEINNSLPDLSEEIKELFNQSCEISDFKNMNVCSKKVNLNNKSSKDISLKIEHKPKPPNKPFNNDKPNQIRSKKMLNNNTLQSQLGAAILARKNKMNQQIEN